MPEGPPRFAVRDDLETDLFLQLDQRGDFPVLDLAQGRAGQSGLAGLGYRRRAQQAADMVGAEMKRLGYVEAASPEAASLLVRFDYNVDNGRERIRTTGSPFYDPYWGAWRRPYGFRRAYGFRSPYAFGWHDPFLDTPEVRSYTVYTSDIDLKIDSAATGERLFEGQAQAVSRTNRLQALVPNLVDALFTDFPGNSGETLRITIKDDGKSVRELR